MAQAKEAVVSFGSFNSINMNGTTDSLSVKILTRVGTNSSGALCGGHSNAVGLRLYFDSTIRPAKLGTLTSVASHFSPLALSGVEGLAIEPNDGFYAVSLKLPAITAHSFAITPSACVGYVVTCAPAIGRMW